MNDNFKFMIRIIIISGIIPLLLGCTAKGTNQQSETQFSMERKKAVVYVTADSTQLRITPNDTILFKPQEQPQEKQSYILVDPAHTFQTFMGVGGAITDASAETFYKLPGLQRLHC